jgi:hypothetical protein
MEHYKLKKYSKLHQARIQKIFFLWGGLQNIALKIVPQYNKTIFSSLLKIF